MLHPIQSSSIDWVIDTACRNAARSGVRQGVQETSQGDAQVKDKGRTLRFQLPWLVVESTSGSGRPPEKHTRVVRSPVKTLIMDHVSKRRDLPA